MNQVDQASILNIYKRVEALLTSTNCQVILGMSTTATMEQARYEQNYTPQMQGEEKAREM